MTVVIALSEDELLELHETIARLALSLGDFGTLFEAYKRLVFGHVINHDVSDLAERLDAVLTRVASEGETVAQLERILDASEPKTTETTS